MEIAKGRVTGEPKGAQEIPEINENRGRRESEGAHGLHETDEDSETGEPKSNVEIKIINR
jgi:hypothetical protein